jgi:hypothetical protein
VQQPFENIVAASEQPPSEAKLLAVQQTVLDGVQNLGPDLRRQTAGAAREYLQFPGE